MDAFLDIFHSCFWSYTRVFSIDKPASLAAAMRTDPEELLYNLGFVNNDSSLLHMIPSRFFQQPSDAFGINVEEIHMSLLAQEDEQVTSSSGFA